MVRNARNRSASLDAGFRSHYGSGVERDRLLKGASNLEYERTKEILLRYLPENPQTILDVGGGPGRYSLWLAEMGHSVHLVDVFPLHIQQARRLERKSKAHLASFSLGDARKLDFQDEFADLLLLFGPLYHLVRRPERMRALSEAFRVLKPGGILFAAAISRFTSTLDGSVRGYIRDPEFMKIVRQDLRNGQHRNPTKNLEYFTTAFFHHPNELEAEIRGAGFKNMKILAVTGFAWLLPNLGKFWKSPMLKARLMTLLEETESEPSLMGQSDHLLAVGRKKR